MSFRFISLASGSSGNCYFLGNEEYGILFDAGIGPRTIKKRLKDKGLPFDNILALFITHDHTDHVKYAGALGEKSGIPVYTTELIHEGMDKNINMVQKLSTAKKHIQKETPLTLRDLKITAFEVPHDGTDNIGYFVEWEDQCFAIATDLGHIPESVANYLKRANYLVIEANYDAALLATGPYPAFLKTRISQGRGHLCNDQTADFLAGIYHPRLTHIFLCHLSQENNQPDLAVKTVAGKLKASHGATTECLTLVSLPRTGVSDLYIL